jgi:hypothetical protein
MKVLLQEKGQILEEDIVEKLKTLLELYPFRRSIPFPIELNRKR